MPTSVNNKTFTSIPSNEERNYAITTNLASRNESFLISLLYVRGTSQRLSRCGPTSSTKLNYGAKRLSVRKSCIYIFMSIHKHHMSLCLMEIYTILGKPVAQITRLPPLGPTCMVTSITIIYPIYSSKLELQIK